MKSESHFGQKDDGVLYSMRLAQEKDDWIIPPHPHKKNPQITVNLKLPSEGRTIHLSRFKIKAE